MTEGEDGPDRDELRDLRRSLYGLHAVLSLHFAQEDEIYAALADEAGAHAAGAGRARAHQR